MLRTLVCLLLTTVCLQTDVLARPNLVLIVADDLDQNLGTLDFMPNLHRLLVQQGLTFSDFFATSALPDGATAGTRRRIAELGGRSPVQATW